MPSGEVAAVVRAYVKAVDVVFLLGVPVSLIALVPALESQKVGIKPPQEAAMDAEKSARGRRQARRPEGPVPGCEAE